MRQTFPVVLLFAAIAMAFGTSSSEGYTLHKKQATISGEILSQENEKVSDAYVYVISGEEETLSLKDGRFSLKTWQPLPITLTIEHKNFQRQQVVIREIGKDLRVTLTGRKDQ